MANRGRATFAKRQKEIARQERAREKVQKRVEREETKPKLDRAAMARQWLVAPLMTLLAAPRPAERGVCVRNREQPAEQPLE